MVVITVVVIPIVREFSPETFLHIMLELWIESENDIITKTNTDNNISETDNNLIEETDNKNVATPIVY
jgi:hypothetical protein